MASFWTNRFSAAIAILMLSFTSSAAFGEIVPKNYNGLPVIILKIDDLKNYKLPQLPNDEARWDRFVAYVKSKGMKANIGAIGSHFDAQNAIDLEFFADLQADILDTNVVELFNHSYCYCPEAFSSTAKYNEQFDVLDQAQVAVRRAMGITMVGFGSGGNVKSQDTVSVMNRHPDMKVWFYGKDDYSKVSLDTSKVLNLTREWRYDDLDEIASVSTFLNNFENVKDNPFMVFQGHAGKWTNAQFNMFKKSFDALLAKYPKLRFMTVSEYYGYVTGTTSAVQQKDESPPLPPQNINIFPIAY